MKNVSKIWNIIIAGVGGQGTVLAGQILADIAMRAGYTVREFENRGMARRGGAVAAQLRIGKNIYTPIIQPGTCNLLLAFEPMEALRYLHFINATTGSIILNTRAIAPVHIYTDNKLTYPSLTQILCMLNRYCKHTIAFDATAIAEALGDPIVTNMVLLGAAAYSADLPFSKQAFAKAIRRKVPSSRLKLNLAAFNAGYEEAKKLR